MGTMLKVLAAALSITGTGAQAGQLLATTPFVGGRNRNAILKLDAVPAGGGVVKIQGSSNDIHTTPGTSDPSWTDIVTLNASSPLEQEIQLPQWIRTNVTTGGTGTVQITLNGVQ